MKMRQIASSTSVDDGRRMECDQCFMTGARSATRPHRWGDANDVQRSVRIMMAAGFKGTFALEYESGPLNGVEGAKYLYKEVLAALSSGSLPA